MSPSSPSAPRPTLQRADVWQEVRVYIFHMWVCLITKQRKSDKQPSFLALGVPSKSCQSPNWWQNWARDLILDHSPPLQQPAGLGAWVEFPSMSSGLCLNLKNALIFTHFSTVIFIALRPRQRSVFQECFLSSDVPFSSSSPALPLLPTQTLIHMSEPQNSAPNYTQTSELVQFPWLYSGHASHCWGNHSELES